MRRQTPIAHLLYAHLFPRPKDDDPPSFAAHLALNLVQEVRVEVGLFYGDLVTIEAKYPGLDYCYGPHRMRLGRFPHHARLFAAFDALNLTYQEIQDFCCWEGTRWARERYEKDEGCIIEDTTGDHIPLFVDPKQREHYSQDRHLCRFPGCTRRPASTPNQVVTTTTSHGLRSYDCIGRAGRRGRWAGRHQHVRLSLRHNRLSAERRGQLQHSPVESRA
jgi:hypothetical protein